MRKIRRIYETTQEINFILPVRDEPVGDEYSDVVPLTAIQREQLQGLYGKGMSITIIQKDGKLWARVASLPYFELVALSGSELTERGLTADLFLKKIVVDLSTL